MDRRKFLESMGGGGFALWTFRAQVLVLSLGHDDEARAEMVYDLVMECWSTLGSGRLGEQKQPLEKAKIIAGQALIAIAYDQDDHGHTFDLTAKHLRDLLEGRIVRVLTTEAQGHTHEVRIDPKNHANENGVERPKDVSPALPEGGAKPPEAQSSANLQAILDQHCTECHHAGSAAPHDMTKPLPASLSDRIIERVSAPELTTRMPPGFRRKLSATEIEALKRLLK